MKKISIRFALLATSLLLAISCAKPEVQTTPVPAPTPEPVAANDTLVDARDNQSYPIIIIDGKKWMAKNLNYAGVNGELGKAADNNADGRVYAVAETKLMAACTRMFCMDGTNDCNRCVGGFCPRGWHVPSKEELEKLIAFVGGNEATWWNSAEAEASDERKPVRCVEGE